MEPFWLAELVEGIVRLSAHIRAGRRGAVVLVPCAGPPRERGSSSAASVTDQRLLYFDRVRERREHVLEGVCIVPWGQARSDAPHLDALSELRRSIVWTRGDTDIAISAACFDGVAILAEVRVALFDGGFRSGTHEPRGERGQQALRS